MTSARRFEDVSRIIALVLIAAVLWCYVYNRWTWEAWQTPLEYGLKPADGDTLSVLAYIKSAMDGHFWPLLLKNDPRLGAPFGGNWNDWPLVEQLIFFSTGTAARVIGLFPAINAAVLFAYILAAVTFYAVCRALKCDWRWAFVGGLIFAFARYSFARQVHHLQVLYYWHIPACMLVVWWLFSSQGIRRGETRFWVAAVIAAITGASHPYYTNMFVQLAGIACLTQFLRGNRRSAFAGALIIAIAIGVFLLMCGNVLYYWFAYGPNDQAVVRNFGQLELFALKPLDMIMPPPDHRLSIFANFAQNYFHDVFVPGEAPLSNYLGLAGIAALGYLIYLSLRRLLEVPGRVPPLETWVVFWIVLYSVVGGFNCLIGSAGLQLFRSSDRYSIFILTIVLTYGIRRLSQIRWQGISGYLIPSVVLIIALYDQMPVPPSLQEIRAVDDVISADRQFVADMDRKLPKDAMVFQIPVMWFPEDLGGKVPAYDHFRPYLYSKDLKFSFGSCKGRPEADWQRDLLTMDFPSVVAALESYGFSAIYINRNGFQDKGEEIVRTLASLGRTEIIESPSGDRISVVLTPSRYPIKPFLMGTRH